MEKKFLKLARKERSAGKEGRRGQERKKRRRMNQIKGLREPLAGVWRTDECLLLRKLTQQVRNN